MTETITTRTFVGVLRFVGRYWLVSWLQFAGVLAGLCLAVAAEVQVPTRASELVTALRSWADGRPNVSPDEASVGAQSYAAEFDAALTAALLLLVTIALVSVMQQLYVRLYLHFTADVMRRVVNDGFAHVQRFGADWHANHFAGATVRKITRGMWAYDNFADMIIINLGPALALLFGFTVEMTRRDPWLGLYFGAGVTVFLLVSALLSMSYVAPANERSNEADTEMGAALADAITCNPVVKGFGAEDREDRRMQGVTQRWRNRSRYAWRRSTDAGAVQSVMLVALLGGLIGIVFRQASGPGTQVDELVYVLTAYFVVNGSLRNVGWQIRELQRSVDELSDLVKISETPPQVADRPNAPALRPGEGAVRFENVRFKYPKQSDPVFDGLTVDIRPGEKVALVGPSGAGKTTFVKLVQRLYDVDGGRIVVDGQDISEVQQSSVRRAFAIVPQEPILFHRSLAENIAYGSPDASQEAIEAAARRARAHDFISRLPQGYDTLVGERGIKLSGGERQRVAIARAILADAPFLILDEATSSLDSETEHLIQRAVEEALRDRTAFLIAHRLSTVRKVDRILVFDHGRIVEQGTHDQLIADPNGHYRRLHDVQALGFVDADDVHAPSDILPAAS